MSGLLDGKQLVITGVITESSIAYAVARLAQEEGAKIVLTAYGRPSLVARLARRLPVEPPVVELDVTDVWLGTKATVPVTVSVTAKVCGPLPAPADVTVTFWV